jgi:hypothetical protein
VRKESHQARWGLCPSSFSISVPVSVITLLYVVYYWDCTARIGHALVVFILLVFLTRILDLKSSALFPQITCPRLRSLIIGHGIVVPYLSGAL